MFSRKPLGQGHGRSLGLSGSGWTHRASAGRAGCTHSPSPTLAFAASVPSTWNAASSLTLLHGPAHDVLPPP